MKAILAIALSAILAAIVTAASAQTIYQSTDKFNGSVVYNTERRSAHLEGGSFWSSRFVDFQFMASRPASNIQFPYVVAVHTQTPDWIFVSSGASLILKLNGTEMIPLVGSGSINSREVGVGGNVTEDAFYAISPDILEKIANAHTVEFRIIGDRQIVTGSWAQELIADATALSTRGSDILGISLTQGTTGNSNQTSITKPNWRPIFGVGSVNVTPQLASLMKLSEAAGVLVVKVFPASIASNAGIMNGDVILKFGATEISKPEELQTAVSRVEAGQHISVTIWRASEQQSLDAQF